MPCNFQAAGAMRWEASRGRFTRVRPPINSTHHCPAALVRVGVGVGRARHTVSNFDLDAFEVAEFQHPYFRLRVTSFGEEWPNGEPNAASCGLRVQSPGCEKAAVIGLN